MIGKAQIFLPSITSVIRLPITQDFASLKLSVVPVATPNRNPEVTDGGSWSPGTVFLLHVSPEASRLFHSERGFFVI